VQFVCSIRFWGEIAVVNGVKHKNKKQKLARRLSFFCDLLVQSSPL